MGCGRLAEEFGFDLEAEPGHRKSRGRNQFAEEVSEAGWTAEFSLKVELICRQLLPLQYGGAGPDSLC